MINQVVAFRFVDLAILPSTLELDIVCEIKKHTKWITTCWKHWMLGMFQYKLCICFCFVYTLLTLIIKVTTQRQFLFLNWPGGGVIHIFIYIADDFNLALSRPAYQSSTWRGRVATLAVDGMIGDGSSAMTGPDYHSWWKVHLATPVWVTHVEITNRLYNGKQIDLFLRICNTLHWSFKVGRFENVSNMQYSYVNLPHWQWHTVKK